MVGESFWSGKCVFLTGHTGFKGSWLSIWLRMLGTKVVGYSLPPSTSPNLFDLAHVGKDVISIHGDVRNVSSLKEALKEHRPEIVIHMAAQALVRQSYKDPLETYSTNVMGTVHTLEAVRGVGGVKAVLIVTSDKCYVNREWPWGYRETDPVGGADPYSSSKGCAELVSSAYRQSFFNPTDHEKHGIALATVRAGNVIGGGDWSEDRLIPDIIRSFLGNESVRIRFPLSVRPWQHVLEALNAYLIICEKLYLHGPEFAEAWNIGPRGCDCRTVEWIARQMIALWGENGRVEFDRHDQPHEACTLKLDCSKTQAKLNWNVRTDVLTALEWTVAWYKEYQRNPLSIRQFTEEQIRRYDEKRSNGIN